jgi:hypothetical protein
MSNGMIWLLWQCRFGFEEVAARRMKFLFFKDGDGEHLYAFLRESIHTEISPLRCAPVEMTKGRAALPARLLAEQEPFFITLGGLKARDFSVEKHFQGGATEPQVPPLRCAPVEMTKGRAALPARQALKPNLFPSEPATTASSRWIRGWAGSGRPPGLASPGASFPGTRCRCRQSTGRWSAAIARRDIAPCR